MFVRIAIGVNQKEKMVDNDSPMPRSTRPAILKTLSQRRAGRGAIFPVGYHAPQRCPNAAVVNATISTLFDHKMSSGVPDCLHIAKMASIAARGKSHIQY